MDIKIIPPEMRDALRESFPTEAIAEYPSKPYLTTIKAMWVIERLNTVFGIGGWTLTHEIISDTDDYVTVRGRLVLINHGFTTPDQYGGHQKSGTGTEPADGYKSAVTDCLSKCASLIEIGVDVFKGLVQPPKPPERRATRLHTEASPPPSQKTGGATTATQGRHWCEEHQTEWFQRGRMKGHAHPIADGGGKWCNMPEDHEDKDWIEITDADAKGRAEPAHISPVQTGQQIYEADELPLIKGDEHE